MIKKLIRNWLLDGNEIKKKTEELEYATTYKIGDMTLFVTEEMVFIAQDGQMIQIPTPKHMETLENAFQEDYAEGEENLEIMSIDYLEFLLERKEKAEDFEACAHIREVLAFKRGMNGLNGPID